RMPQHPPSATRYSCARELAPERWQEQEAIAATPEIPAPGQYPRAEVLHHRGSLDVRAVRLLDGRLLQAEAGEGFRVLVLKPADHLLADLTSEVPGGRRIPGAHQGAHLDGALVRVDHLQASDPV